MTENASGRRVCADGGALGGKMPGGPIRYAICSDRFYGGCSVRLARHHPPNALTPRQDKRIAAAAKKGQ
jgi:hypothetical protein